MTIYNAIAQGMPDLGTPILNRAVEMRQVRADEKRNAMLDQMRESQLQDVQMQRKMEDILQLHMEAGENEAAWQSGVQQRIADGRATPEEAQNLLSNRAGVIRGIEYRMFGPKEEKPVQWQSAGQGVIYRPDTGEWQQIGEKPTPEPKMVAVGTIKTIDTPEGKQPVVFDGSQWRPYGKPAPATSGTMPAPSLTEVVDPKDPTRLLRVDARLYEGGSVGDKGVLGVSGKEPTNAAKETQTDAGRQDLSDMVASLRDIYRQLDEKGGITSTERSPGENVGAYISASGIGQAIGQAFGTDEQSLRNEIAQQRPLLLQAIRKATGMTAKELDSNVELQLYLRAATDPQLDVQANRQALDMLESLYGVKPTATSSPASSESGGNVSALPQVGEVVDGYIYLGGDPNSESSWKPQ